MPWPLPLHIIASFSSFTCKGKKKHSLTVFKEARPNWSEGSAHPQLPPVTVTHVGWQCLLTVRPFTNT